MNLGTKIEAKAGDSSQQYISLGDIKNYHTTNHFTTNLTYSSIERYLNLYKAESVDPNFKAQTDFIKNLERFIVNTATNIRSLEEKLTDGGFEIDIEYALQVKEDFNKFLTENKFYSSIQKLNAYLLAQIYDQFNTYILPEIRKGTDPTTIKYIIQERIINPIEQQINGNDCDFDIMPDQIRGMIYFLTGKCHINWK